MLTTKMQKLKLLTTFGIFLAVSSHIQGGYACTYDEIYNDIPQGVYGCTCAALAACSIAAGVALTTTFYLACVADYGPQEGLQACIAGACLTGGMAHCPNIYWSANKPGPQGQRCGLRFCSSEALEAVRYIEKSGQH